MIKEKEDGHMIGKRKRETVGKPQTKAIKKNSIMQSGERAVFSPHFLPLLHKTGRSFLYGRY